jgi:hypothetical protein
MNKVFAFAAVAAFGMGGVIAALAHLACHPADRGLASEIRPAWTETQWPFPMDQWGKGKAFRCGPANCGAEVALYLRAKIGFCNCTTGVANDDDLDRMSDFDLVGGEVVPLQPGRPIAIARMKGRTRAYGLRGRSPSGQATISIVFNDRCDMIVATIVLPHDKAAQIEPGVIEFLNSKDVLHWAEVTLGL